jgi:large subunit ribosomal protein L25
VICAAFRFASMAMADIILNIEVRERSGTGGARETRRAGKVPGVLYGGPRGPASIAVRANEFRKALHSGKLLGHMVTLKIGDETQRVIAKDIQFHPVNDEPIHFDLYRVSEHQLIRISVPVHFHNQEASPGLKRGGALNVALHELELEVPADQIPEALNVDLSGLDIGDTVKAADIPLPTGSHLTAHHRDVTVASIATSSAMQSVEATEGATEATPEA